MDVKAMHPEPLVVATLNLLDDLRFWEERRVLLVEGYARLHPHLIALQEISLEGRNAQWLAAELGGYSVHLSPRGPDPHSDSLAILSRLPVEDHRILPLQEQDRSAHSVTVRHGGSSVVFANTHLHWHPISESTRVAQVERILSWLPAATPAVLCGDLNAFPRSATVALLKRHLNSAYATVHGDEPAYTYPTLLKRGFGVRHSARDVVLRANGLLRTRHNVKHGGAVDYVFVTPDLSVEDCDAMFATPAPHDERLYASDHVGLWARLRPAAPASATTTGGGA